MGKEWKKNDDDVCLLLIPSLGDTPLATLKYNKSKGEWVLESIALGIYNQSFGEESNIDVIMKLSNDMLYKASQVVTRCAQKVEEELAP